MGPLTLRPITEPWATGPSISMLLRRRARQEDLTLAEAFAPCKLWFEWLGEASRSRVHPGRVEGRHLDSIWRNAFVNDGRCVFIDQEWEWHAPLKSKLLVIRSMRYFCHGRGGASAELMTQIAAAFGVRLSSTDFDEFVDLESRLLEIVFGKNRDHARRGLAFELDHPHVHARLREMKRLAQSFRGR